MADQGAFGKVYQVKQAEKHFGPHADWFWDVEKSGGGVFMDMPHADWFWDVEKSGGGVFMDMGCHGIAFCYWFLGRPKIESVYCQMATQVHADKTKGEDENSPAGRWDWSRIAGRAGAAWKTA